MGSPDARALRYGSGSEDLEDGGHCRHYVHPRSWLCTPSSLYIINPFEPELMIKCVCVCERERKGKREDKVWEY
jgi:hypothetical protein